MSDLFKTQTELENQVLLNLNALETGQEPEAEDQARVRSFIIPMLDQLEVDGVCAIADRDEIPNELFLPLAQLGANEAATSFGQQFSYEKKVLFEGIIRRLNSGPVTREVTRMEYF